MGDSYRLFKLALRRDEEWPLFVRNVTDEPIEIKFYYDGDYRVWKHPLKDWKTLRIPPGQLLNLRYLLTEEPLHCNLHLLWFIERERLIVVDIDHHYWGDYAYPEECEELKQLYDESMKIVRMTNDRWRLVQATKEKYGASEA